MFIKVMPLKENHLSHKGLGYLLFALVILLLFQLSGCALIGYGVGAIVDSSSGKRSVISIDNRLLTLAPGANLTLYLKTGRHEKGKFIGLLYVPRTEYAEIYTKVRDEIKDEVALPALGERITVVKKRWISEKPETSRTEEVEFFGFDYGGISVRESGLPQPTIIPLSYLQSISDQKGNILNMDFIKRLIAEQKVPFLSLATIRLKTKAKEVRVDLADIDLIEVTGQRIRGNLFLMGLGIDIFVFLAVPLASPYIWILFGGFDL